MAGNTSGGKQAARKLKSTDPDFYKRIGAMGGRAGTGHAFAHGVLDPSETGKLSRGIERRKRK